MEINSNTSIELLVKEKIISMQLYNNLRRIKLYAVGEIIDYMGSKGELCFLKEHRFGKKSLDELKRFFLDNSVYLNLSLIPKDVVHDFILLGNKIFDRYYKNKSELSIFYDNNYDFFVDLLNFNENSIVNYYYLKCNNIIDVFNLLFVDIEILNDFILEEENYDLKFYVLWKQIKKILSLIKNDITRYENILKIELLKRKNIDIDFLLNYKLNEIVSQYPVRSRNLFLKNNKSYQDVLFTSLNKNQFDLHCKTKSYQDVNSITERFYNLVSDILTQTEEILEFDILIAKYKFLDKTDIYFLKKHIEHYNEVPMFFLLLKYIQNSDKKELKYYSLFYGLNGLKKESKKEISNKFNITEEGVRQIIARASKILINIDLFRKEKWCNYTFLEKPFFSEKDSFIRECLDKENLNFLSFEDFYYLYNLIFDCKLLNIGKKKYILTSDLYKSFDFSSAFIDIKLTLSKDVTKDLKIPIKFFIESYWLCSLKINIYKDIVLQLISEYIIEEYNFKIENDLIIIPPNAINIEDELYRIIKKNKVPMHLNDIFYVFKQKYPDHKFVNPEQIKSVIFKSDKIISVGNTLTYSLIEWKNLFYIGTITDLMYKVIDENNEPINILDLYAKIKLYFPKTTQKSILSLAGREKFVRFENGFIGLSGKEYSVKYIPLPSRLPFSVRLIEFISFLKTHHHLPMNSGSESEATLYRWYNNVLKRRLELTTAEINEFNNVLEEYKDYLVTSVEYTFFRKCEDFRIYIEDNMEFPTHKNEPRLYFWFLKYKDKYLEFNDRRKYYFEDLLNLLKLYGFEF